MIEHVMLNVEVSLECCDSVKGDSCGATCDTCGELCIAHSCLHSIACWI